MDNEFKKMEIYTKATNIQVLVMNNCNIDYLIEEINYIKKLAEEIKEDEVRMILNDDGEG